MQNPEKRPKTRLNGFAAWFSALSDNHPPRKGKTQHPGQSTQQMTGKATPSKAKQQAKQSQQAQKASKKQWAKLCPDAKHQKKQSEPSKAKTLQG